MRNLSTILLSTLLLSTSLSAIAIEFKGQVQYTDGSPVGGAIVYGCRTKTPLRVHNNVVMSGEALPRAITNREGHFTVDIPWNGSATFFAQDMLDQAGFVSNVQTGQSVVITIFKPAAFVALLPDGKALDKGESLNVFHKGTGRAISYAFTTSSRIMPPYDFNDLMPGKYQVMTTAVVPQVGCCFKRVVTRHVEANIKSNTSEELAIGGFDMPYVAGRITSSVNAPLHGVWVRLVPKKIFMEMPKSLSVFDENDASSAPINTPRVWSAVTDNQGRYRILDVPPGIYQVRSFRRLALNNGMRTLEAIEEITIPIETKGRTEIAHDMVIELEQFLPLEIASIAPVFEGETLNGQPINLESLRGNVVVLHFFAAWCSTCVQTIGDYDALARSIADKKLTVIGVSLDESLEEAQAFYKKNNIQHPVIYQGSYSQNPIRKDYRVVGIPETFVIAPDGRISQLNIHGDVLKNHIKQLLR